MSVMFSILINLFNKEHTIAATLESVCGQDFENFEVIICDYGSSDKSHQIAKRYENDKVKVITGVNQGMAQGKNELAKFALGEYLVFVDGDDIWAPDLLSKVYSVSCETQSDIIASNYENSPQKNAHFEGRFEILSGRDYLLKRLLGWGLQTSFVFLRRETFLSSSRFPWEVQREGSLALMIWPDEEIANQKLKKNNLSSDLEVTAAGRVSIPGPGGEDQFLIDNLIIKNGCAYIPEQLGLWRNDVCGQASLIVHKGYWPVLFVDNSYGVISEIYKVHQVFGYLKHSLTHYEYFRWVKLNFGAQGKSPFIIYFIIYAMLGVLLRISQKFYHFLHRRH